MRKESGRLAIRYLRIFEAFDREYEHRLAAAKPLQLEDILKDPLVALRIAEWEQFTSRYTSDRTLVEFMSGDDVIADYNSYVAITTQVGFNMNPALLTECMMLDSAGLVVFLARLIDKFNERQSKPSVLEDFFHLGMAGKLADELADLATDHAEGRDNLLLAMLAQHPAEHASIIPRLEQSVAVPISLWLELAPQTFEEFSRMFESHYRRLRAPELRRICDATMLKAARGPKKRRSSSDRRHVLEPPSQPWR